MTTEALKTFRAYSNAVNGKPLPPLGPPPPRFRVEPDTEDGWFNVLDHQADKGSPPLIHVQHRHLAEAYAEKRNAIHERDHGEQHRMPRRMDVLDFPLAESDR